MIVFWLVAACLVAAALLFVVPPLLRKNVVKTGADHDQLNIDVYRDQLAELDRDLENNTIDKAYYERTYQEIERRLLQDVQLGEQKKKQTTVSPMDRGLAISFVVAVPVVSIYLYLSWGQPAAITGDIPVATSEMPEGHPNVEGDMADAGVAADGEAAPHPDTGAQVEAMVAQLAARMEQNPDDMEGWLMLARSYRYLRRHEDAVQAFEKALPMLETNAQLMADYADTLAMAANGVLDGKPIEYIRKAAQLDPNNIQSLWLLGTYHYEKGDYADALGYWRRLKRLVEPGSQDSDAMASNIAEVELRMKELNMEIPREESLPDVTPKVPGVISGKVSLQDDIKDKASPDDTVFIYARAVDGPRMPLAILRKKVSDLPADFVLDESLAMMPAMSLSNYSDVIVGARISKSGNATPQSGDLEGVTQTVKVGVKDLQIVINTVVP